MKPTRRNVLMTAFLLTGLCAIGQPANAEDKPDILRIGVTGNTYGKPFGGGVIGVLQDQRRLDTELQKLGVKVEYVVFKGTGPAINEAFANRSIDVAAYGDLPVILGKSGGLNTTIISAGGRGTNLYIAVAPDSSIKSLDELKGKRVATQKGTYMHLAFNKLIKSRGETEKDFKFLNLAPADGYAALQAGGIEAFVGPAGVIDLRNQGRARILYTNNTPDAPPEVAGFGAIVADSGFLAKYPSVVKVFLREYLRAAYWATQPENRDAYLRISAKTGTSVESLAEDISGKPLAWTLNPVLDDFFVKQLRSAVDFSLENGLLRKPVEIDSFLYAALQNELLKELGHEAWWKAATRDRN